MSVSKKDPVRGHMRADDLQFSSEFILRMTDATEEARNPREEVTEHG